MKTFNKIFFTGLAAVLPVLFTVYIVIWLGTSAESLLGGLMKTILPYQWYVPGLGLMVGVVLLLFAGILLRLWVVRRLFGMGERLFNRIPLVKAIYSSLRNLVIFFTSGKEEGFSQVVTVRISASEMRLLGFITREDFTDLPSGLADSREVAVYLPMSYQLGGYTAILPRAAIEPVSMSVQEAMKFALTGGMKSKAKFEDQS
jgi:uncharacterized membrane protein